MEIKNNFDVTKRASSDVFCWTEEKEEQIYNNHQRTLTNTLLDHSSTSFSLYYGVDQTSGRDSTAWCSAPQQTPEV